MEGKRSVEDRYLYKGKRVDNSEWICGSLITGVFTRSGQDIPYILCPDKANYDCFEDFSEENGIFEVIPETVCQYTGLTDKNGRKIFEGDIVKDDSVQLKGAIKFSERYLQFVVDDVDDGEQDYSNFMKEVEVIGNIFDNPELLEAEDI